MKNINIYISTFGQKVLKQTYSRPIEVGAALRDNFLYDLKDNTGDNISTENMFFGELSGLYWIWKNDNSNENDIIGFFHYNKGLDIGKQQLLNLGKNEWMVLKKCINNPHPISNEIIATRNIIKNYFPKYLDAWDFAYRTDGSGDICNAAQLFVTTYKEFREYSEFLFGVLMELRKVIGDGDDSPYYKRYCAFMGERLLTVYLIANNKIIIEKNMKYPNRIKTLFGRFINFIGFNKKSFIYLFLQRRYGHKSSYKK